MDIERKRLQVALVTLAITIGGSVIASAFALGWPAASALTVLASVLIGRHLFRYRDRLLGLLCVVGLVAGFAELFSDYWAIEHFGALFYPQDEPMIWRSPLYMPFAWAVIVVQLSVVGRWFTGRFGLGKAIALTAVFGGINIPLYEHLAKDANQWHYENCRMLFNSTPYFIIIFEVLISAALPWIATWVEKRSFEAAAAIGLAEGAWMWVALMIGWNLAGPLP